MNCETLILDNSCRLCLSRKGDHSLFLNKTLKNYPLSCADFIMKISSVPVYEDDGLPQKICNNCFIKLRSVLKFKHLCEESYVRLLAHIQTKSAEVCRPEISQNNNDQEYDRDELVVKIKDEVAISDNENEADNIENNFDDFSSKDHETSNKSSSALKSDSKSCFSTNFKKETDDQSFTNTYVSSSSKSKTALGEKRENGTKGNRCKLCSKIFLRPSSLKLHLLKHKGELPYACPHPGCSKTFPIKSRLTIHMKVHTDERPFICQYCSHAARDKQQLNVHIRYFHTKERNFKCKECGKGFVSPQARYYHAKRHENVRNHHCTYCTKSFVFAFGLQEHLLTHTGEKRFACVLCGTKFSRKAHKLKHEASIHGLTCNSSARSPKATTTSEQCDQM